MRSTKLSHNFFAKNTLWVAKNLLGKYLCRRLPSGKVIDAMITETEAYLGFNDKASHARKGRTKRTEVMFGPPGTIYVYLIYGMYHCLNLVTEKENYPAAVLIRGVAGVNGPGKVCRHFQIDRSLNNQKLGQGLWVEDRRNKKSPLRPDVYRDYEGQVKIKYKKLKRVGVDYAGESKNRPWRFLIAD
ncbi:MAG: DNA-3-methyladenine glycosylase [Patescibacteria group bacterium]